MHSSLSLDRLLTLFLNQCLDGCSSQGMDYICNSWNYSIVYLNQCLHIIVRSEVTIFQKLKYHSENVVFWKQHLDYMVRSEITIFPVVKVPYRECCILEPTSGLHGQVRESTIFAVVKVPYRECCILEPTSGLHGQFREYHISST